MRKWVLKLHLYLGLLCSGYLILFGVSSLNFNHKFAFTEPPPRVVNWQQTVSVKPAPDRTAYADSVRDALDLMGWTIPWETRVDANGDLHSAIGRPGKNYKIDLIASNGLVNVEERQQGVWPVIRQLHGFLRLPNARFVSLWGWYTELCTIVVIFSAVTGIYLFAGRRSERLLNWGILSLAAALSLAFMAYIHYRG